MSNLKEDKAKMPQNGVSTMQLEMAKLLLEQRIELNRLILEKLNLGEEYFDTRLTDALADINGVLRKKKGIV